MKFLQKLCNIGFFNEKSNTENKSDYLNPMRVYPEEEKHDIESNTDEVVNRISDSQSEDLSTIRPHYCISKRQILFYILIMLFAGLIIVIIHYIDYAIYDK
jgi:hypothetical protein